MKKVVFSKYSNDRSRDFKIRTDILEDETGRRYVRKVGMTGAGRQHLERVHDLSQQMKSMYEHSVFEVNRSEFSDGTLKLEYIEGRTLEDILDQCLAKKKLDKFQDFLSVYASEMRKLADTEFVPCQNYYAMFGGDAFSASGKMSARISNIDIIFPNLIENGSCWTVLDAEWTFEVLIPVDYILFRAAHYYVTPGRQKQMGDLDIYALLGVNGAECEIYQKMEEHFQQFVCANNVPLWRLYDTMGKKYYFPAGMIKEQSMQEIRSRVCAVFYTGERYREQEISAPEDDQGGVSFEIPVDGGCDTIQINPGYAPCVVYVKEVTGVTDSGGYDMLYGVNGASSDNRLIYFDTDLPQILTNDIREDLQKIRVRFEREFVHRAMIGHLREKAQAFSNMRFENQKKDMRIAELEGGAAVAADRIRAMENSASWRLTEPMRKLRAHVRKQE